MPTLNIQKFAFASALFVGIVYILAGLGNLNHIAVGADHLWHTQDDHMISQRVAWNFWKYGKPVYNLGEDVAANTSLFWPIFLSNFYYFADLENGIVCVVIFTAALSALTIINAASLLPNNLYKIVFSAFIVLSPVYLFFGMSGWEHVPQMLFVTAALVSVLHASGNEGRLHIPTGSLLLLAVAFLIRPDTAPTIAIFVLFWLSTDRRYRQVKSYVILAALCLVPLFYLFLMYEYYGDLVPNTAHLKIMEFQSRFLFGFKYILNPHKTGIVPALVLLLIVLRPRIPGASFVVFGAAMQILFVITLGGDYFSHGRFFMIYFPALTAIVFLYFSELSDRKTILPAVNIIPFIVVVLGIWHIPYTFIPFLTEKPYFRSIAALEQQLVITRSIRDNLDPADGSVGLHWLGIGYHLPNFHIVDFLGKADPVIARTAAKWGPVGHNKWDYDYSLATYDIAAIPMEEKIVLEVNDPEFELRKVPHSFYQVAVGKIMATGNYTFLPPSYFANEPGGVGLYVRNDLLDRFVD